MADILIVNGSPRKDGNTDILTYTLLESALEHGASAEKVRLVKLKLKPCLECGGCDETGRCILKDDGNELFDKIADAHVLVVASPIFFYNITSITQAMVERSQACWVKKYLLKQGPWGGRRRKGIFISVGATKGKMLFDGVVRVMRYFFDAVDADYEGALLYRNTEAKGAIKRNVHAMDHMKELGERLAKGADLSGFKALER